MVELSLQPAREKHLRVVMSDGSPYRQAVSIYSPTGDTLAWSDAGRIDGGHGPFDWFGGDLVVDCGNERTWSTRLSSSELEQSDELTVTRMIPTGTIEIRGAPPGYAPWRLCAKLGLGLGGTVYRASATVGGKSRFESLPCGSDLVGPEQWILGTELQSVSIPRVDEPPRTLAIRTIVQPGQMAVVDWGATWSAGSPIEGQVRVLGAGLVPVLLVAVYGRGVLDPETSSAMGIPTLAFGRRSPSIPLDANGRYRIAADDPLPTLLVACIPQPTGWGGVQGLHAIESLLPGESIEVRTGSIELRASNPEARGDHVVSIVIPTETFRHPVETAYAVRRQSWTPPQPLVLSAVPVAVRTLLIDGRPVPVEVRVGALTRVEIELATRPKPNDGK